MFAYSNIFNSRCTFFVLLWPLTTVITDFVCQTHKTWNIFCEGSAGRYVTPINVFITWGESPGDRTVLVIYLRSFRGSHRSISLFRTPHVLLSLYHWISLIYGCLFNVSILALDKFLLWRVNRMFENNKLTFFCTSMNFHVIYIIFNLPFIILILI